MGGERAEYWRPAGAAQGRRGRAFDLPVPHWNTGRREAARSGSERQRRAPPEGRRNVSGRGSYNGPFGERLRLSPVLAPRPSAVPPAVPKSLLPAGTGAGEGIRRMRRRGEGADVSSARDPEGATPLFGSTGGSPSLGLRRQNRFEANANSCRGRDGLNAASPPSSAAREERRTALRGSDFAGGGSPARAAQNGSSDGAALPPLRRTAARERLGGRLAEALDEGYRDRSPGARVRASTDVEGASAAQYWSVSPSLRRLSARAAFTPPKAGESD